MTSDLTFIINEEGHSLQQRFSELIRDTRFFDCLVGYFYASGFNSIYKSLENTEKIRILIGISTDQRTYQMIEESRRGQQKLFSTKELKDEFNNQVISEMEKSPDSRDVEEGVLKFIEWLISKKLEIRVYPAEKIHAKLYIMTFKEGDRDKGRIITGSSNFTESGLRANLEFNVELKNRSDYDFSLTKFNELWENAVDVSEKYVETVQQKTWINNDITPYELYLKFLYEYLKEKINLDQEELYKEYYPENFMELEYQKDAVRDAKLKLAEYGGVFLSDVVGLGKTYIAAMLAQQLDGRTLVIAPPVLIDEDNPGSWPNVFRGFGVRQSRFESLGKLEKLLEQGIDGYTNVFIDEAHRFRTETTQMYEKLFEICRGKRVILVSATPLNNTPLDILSQIKLFQNAHKSTLPNPKVRDLDKYFKALQAKLKGLNRQADKDEYIRIVQENAQDIRENVLQYLMVRRTRNNITKYYKKDLTRQKLKFPEIIEPQPVVYHFDESLDKIFNSTLELIIKDFRYARYMPLLYLKEELPENKKTPQKNMGRFMRILLLKRLESSFFAFKQSIDRFIGSYSRFIIEYQNGNVYVSKQIQKVFELLDNDDEDSIQKLIDEDRVQKYPSDAFKPEFIDDLKQDLELLKKIKDMWSHVDQDPKLDKFIEILKSDKTLKKHKLLVFTESKDTALYLESHLDKEFKNIVLAFSSHSSEGVRRRIIQNYDANIKPHKQKDDIRILVSTDILSEGVSLHRSNVVINYDIPWNPVRMMQRVGRVNRVSKNPPFSKIYTYNFFPAGPINENIGLKEAAESKIKAFIEMLGNDAILLTDEEIKSHDLFKKLTSKELISGEDEEDDPELKYLTFLRELRDNNIELYERIKRLPKKARTARNYEIDSDSVITFFRLGKLRKVFQTKGDFVNEVDFFTAANILKVQRNAKKEKLSPDFYIHLERNKKAFNEIITSAGDMAKAPTGTSYESKLIKRIKAIIKKPELTDEDEDYLQVVLDLIRDGGLPKATMARIEKSIKNEINPLRILAKIKSGISPNLFQGTFSKTAVEISGTREVVLSEYLRRIEKDE